MREGMGQVKYNERALNDRLQRFVDEKIRQWMKINDLESGPADYEVAFFDEDALGEVSCLVVVQSGSRTWKSWETADNPRLAFNRSLEGLDDDASRLQGNIVEATRMATDGSRRESEPFLNPLPTGH